VILSGILVVVLFLAGWFLVPDPSHGFISALLTWAWPVLWGLNLDWAVGSRKSPTLVAAYAFLTVNGVIGILERYAFDLPAEVTGLLAILQLLAVVRVVVSLFGDNRKTTIRGSTHGSGSVKSCS